MTKKGSTESQTDWRGDTIVVGGGMAGVCASIAAARLGCRVALSLICGFQTKEKN